MAAVQLSLLDWTPPPAPPVRTGVFAPSWSREETRRMVQLYVQSERPDVAAVARALGRTYSMVSSQASRIGLSFDALGPNAALKKCLLCRDDFWSPHRRQVHICPGCKTSSEFMECA